MKKSELKKTIHTLAKKHGTPLFLISKNLLNEQVGRFHSLLPGITPFYAVKANCHSQILRILAGQGLGFDVASIQEMKMVLDIGVAPDRIIFANTVKRPEALKFAKQNGIQMMTFDSEYELNKIARYAPGSRVLIRIKVPNVGSIVELSLKFGAEPADAIPFLIKAFIKSLACSFSLSAVSWNMASICLYPSLRATDA